MDTVVVFKEELLPRSETFVKAQAEAIKAYEVRYAGLLPATPSLTLDRPALLLVKDLSITSRIKLLSFRRLGLGGAFERTFAQWAPTLIHAHFAPSGTVVLPLADRLRTPLIVTLHGYDVTTTRDRVNLTPLFGKAARFLCVSDFIRKKAIAAGFPEEKLHVHYIGIDCDKFRRNASNGESQKVLFVGRLVEKKGVRWLLNAMKIVQQMVPSASLTLIGNGALRDSLEAQAKQLALRCTFLGAQSSDQVLAHLHDSALLCLPSVTAADGDSEGLGMTMLEALALEVPVIATYHGGIPEVITHGENGLLSAERNVEEMASNISYFLTHTTERLRAGLRGAQVVKERFSLSHQTELLEAHYREVIQGSRALLDKAKPAQTGI